MKIGTPKDAVRKLLDGIPDDASFEDIQYHIYVRSKIDEGRLAVAEGRVISQEDAEGRLARWLGE